MTRDQLVVQMGTEWRDMDRLDFLSPFFECRCRLPLPGPSYQVCAGIEHDERRGGDLVGCDSILERTCYHLPYLYVRCLMCEWREDVKRYVDNPRRIELHMRSGWIYHHRLVASPEHISRLGQARLKRMGRFHSS